MKLKITKAATLMTIIMQLILSSCGQSEAEKAAKRENEGAEVLKRELRVIKQEGKSPGF